MAFFTVPQALQYALERQQAGFLDEAEVIYRQVLAQDPANAEAVHLLGRVALERGDGNEAFRLVMQALQAMPGEARYHHSIGYIFCRAQQYNDAVAACRRAIALAPQYVPAYETLSIALDEAGDLNGAEAAYRVIIQLDPQNAKAHNNLATLLGRTGRMDGAIAALRAAVQLQPAYADARCNLGGLLLERGEVETAIEMFQGAVESRPRSSRTQYLLGLALRKAGRNGEAMGVLREADRLWRSAGRPEPGQPDHADILNELGIALWQQGLLDEAMIVLREAVKANPQLPAARHHLGLVSLAQNAFEEAAASYRAAIELEPANGWHHANLAAALQAMGDLEGALAQLRQGVAISPGEPLLHGGYICTLLADSNSDARAVLAECQRWNTLHAAPLRSQLEPPRNSPQPARRLRVGYVSPDFWAHVIGRNLLPLLANHDRSQFEIFCYSSRISEDEVTAQFRAHADHWCDAKALNDEALAQRIREDGIDILVDLTQHLARNRLCAFARRPAPVQVAFAGYPGTTGLETMDYRLTDPYLDPSSLTDDLYSETSFRLPHSFWCYAPLEPVAINELPALANDWITFGSLNNLNKINDRVLDLWARVLHAVNGSQLLLLVPSPTGRERFAQKLAARGIAPERLQFVAKASHREYLEYHHRFDVMLDSFPYNGHTTSLDALWMGVPVVTLAGDCAIARAGVSQLTNLGLPELIASTPDDFVRIATELAGDLPRLRELRATLRPRMEVSPLMDAPGFARGIENAYREMWRRRK